MTTRIDRIAEARRRISRQRQAIGEEIRAARLSAGLSQAVAGRAARMSHAQFGRIERGVLPGIGLDALSRATAVVGLQLSIRVYPGGHPVRDAGHLKLLRRFRDRLPPGVTWRTEVALPPNGDLRCWDGLAELAGRRAAAEAEMRLGDLQALDRRLALKRRDGGVDVVVLVVADSRWNRHVLAEHREGLRSNFELDGPEILSAFARGTLPDRSGVLVL